MTSSFERKLLSGSIRTPSLPLTITLNTKEFNVGVIGTHGFWLTYLGMPADLGMMSPNALTSRMFRNNLGGG